MNYDDFTDNIEQDPRNFTIKDIIENRFLFTTDQQLNNNFVDSLQNGIFNDNHIYDIFMSKENIQRIQKNIKKAIFNISNGRYKLTNYQNEKSLIHIMNNVYLKHAKFKQNEFVRQVKLLNKYTLDEVIPIILTNIKQQQKYLYDIHNNNTQIGVLPMIISSNKKNKYNSISSIFN